MKLLISDWGPDCNGSRYLLQLIEDKESKRAICINNLLDLIGDTDKCQFKILDYKKHLLNEYIFGEKTSSGEDSIGYFFSKDESWIPLFKIEVVDDELKLVKLKESMFSEKSKKSKK
jgi:hypothetical protein